MKARGGAARNPRLVRQLQRSLARERAVAGRNLAKGETLALSIVGARRPAERAGEQPNDLVEIDRALLNPTTWS